MDNRARYETDFYAWATEQAALLRAGRLDEADIENIAEEIDSMGRREKRELTNRLSTLLTHLLKWRFQPGHRGNSWRLTIREQRARLHEHLEENPSLTPLVPEAIVTSYNRALIAAERETGLPESAFPAVCPWNVDQVLNVDFLPDGT